MNLNSFSLQRKIMLGLATLLLVAFFMPWVDAFIFSLSGFSLPGKMRQLINFAQEYGDGSSSGSFGVFLLNLLYLIPLSAAYLIYLAWTRAKGFLSLRNMGLVTGAIAFVITAYLLLAYGRDVRPLLASGFWLTMLGGLSLLVASALMRGDEGEASLLPAEQQAKLRQQGQQVVSQTSQWLGEKRQQLDHAAEQRRIQGALGLNLNRTLLDAHDQVVATPGTLITHDLIERARAAGVLAQLLDSAEKPGIVPSEPQV